MRGKRAQESSGGEKLGEGTWKGRGNGGKHNRWKYVGGRKREEKRA